MSSPTDDQNELENNSTSEYVKLNVGGRLFFTTISTLTKYKENMLATMFSGRKNMTIDKEGWVLIDRSGKYFGVILNFLRDGTVPLPNLKKDIAELRAEANFFCISDLVKLCDLALAAPTDIHDIGSNTFVVLSKALDENVLKSFTKPAIILILSTLDGTNQYSHLKFFEDASFIYHKNIIFIRYSDNRPCHTWFFYRRGALVKAIKSDDAENSNFLRISEIIASLNSKS